MTKSKIKIGVTSADTRNYLMWLCSRLCINLSGASAISLHPADYTNYQDCDGYVFSGGEDISPSMYNEENRSSININKDRDELEIAIARHAIENGKPVLGICRGAQMINVAKGGTLYQNANEFYENFMPTRSLLGKIFIRRKIIIEKPSLLERLLVKSELKVNTLHHQAINKLGAGLRVIAIDEYGLVQAIENTDTEHPLMLGVQWHPEFLFYSKIHRKLFTWLVNRCHKA